VKGQGRAARQRVKKLYTNKAVMATIVYTGTYTNNTKTRVSENRTNNKSG